MYRKKTFKFFHLWRASGCVRKTFWNEKCISKLKSFPYFLLVFPVDESWRGKILQLFFVSDFMTVGRNLFALLNNISSAQFIRRLPITWFLVLSPNSQAIWINENYFCCPWKISNGFLRFLFPLYWDIFYEGNWFFGRQLKSISLVWINSFYGSSWEVFHLLRKIEMDFPLFLIKFNPFPRILSKSS